MLADTLHLLLFQVASHGAQCTRDYFPALESLDRAEFDPSLYKLST